MLFDTPTVVCVDMRKPDHSASLTVLKDIPAFRILISKHGEPAISRYFANVRGIFQALLRSIVYQQISGKAAASIHGRFVALFPRKNPTPELVLAMPEEKLRACGLSGQKVAYIRDVAQKFSDGTVKPQRFRKMTSDEIIEDLVQIKGIGVWSAHMLLIFTLNRLDILPTGDLAIKKGFQRVYSLKEMPDHKQMEKLAAPWRAHASVASWYLWRASEEMNAQRPGKSGALKKKSILKKRKVPTKPTVRKK